ncbi:DUF6968 family protein [Nocardia tenerifensis]|uniref:DUF6968 family protein n=1 Tax=Nocardia tenerifensis TaxID=228006 RepID=UPI00030D74C3|nr:hypothetical protein [Nocardia tenerifensis]
MNAREFGPPLGTRTVATASGSVDVTIGRPRQDSARPRIYLCPYRIGDRADAYAEGIDQVHALMSAIHSVSAILKIPRDWPGN